ncbi:thiamine pyrophosphate-binding protein [Roseiterribacter gracilis]|uniref:Acetolactate synthase n=1 Tax=Roseiterribacter gracilis TaxID=2812848 RepID=A0A8S8XBT3_9PROT|nr:acetolactate synthase [Rhodospirillales bacterium TMPK1]
MDRVGADLVAEAVVALDARPVWLFPGGTIAPVIDALVRRDVPYLCTRHEQAAGYGAIAATRVLGRPQVVLVSSGPGVTNLVTAIADAYFDGIPLLVLTGQVGTGDLRGDRPIRQRGFQEVDTVGLLRPIAKQVFQPHDETQLRSALAEALVTISSGRPGPVVIDLPMNVQRGVVGDAPLALTKTTTKTQIDADTVAAIAQALKQASRPIVLAGAGVVTSGAEEELRALIDRAPMAVTQSLPALGAFPTSHDLSLGFHGHTGTQYAGRALSEADFILVVGSRLDLRQTGTMVDKFGQSATVARIEIDPGEGANPRVRVDLTVQADARLGLAALRTALDGANLPDWSSWHAQIAGWKKEFALPTGRAGALTPQRVVETADRVTRGRRTIVTSGVGSHQQWAARHFTYDRPTRQWSTSAGHGAMGYDLPAAVGAQVAAPDALVLCFVGDGSLQMNIQELATVAERKLPLKIIVLDNHRFGIVSQFQKLNWGTDPSCGDKYNPDFAAIAKAYGLTSFTVEALDTLEATLTRAVATDGPVLVHCLVEKHEDISPMLLAGQGLDAMWHADA